MQLCQTAAAQLQHALCLSVQPSMTQQHMAHAWCPLLQQQLLPRLQLAPRWCRLQQHPAPDTPQHQQQQHQQLASPRLRCAG
jgi:hypothetical protein